MQAKLCLDRLDRIRTGAPVCETKASVHLLPRPEDYVSRCSVNRAWAPTYRVFISATQVISFSWGAFNDDPRMPRKSAASVSTIIYALP